MSYETMSMTTSSASISEQTVYAFRTFIFNYQRPSSFQSGSLNVSMWVTNVDESKTRPEILGAMEDTLREGAEVWKELAKY